MSDELPQGWAKPPLAEIAEINPRHPKGLDDSMPISFVRMAAVSESKPQFDSLEVRKLGEVRKGFTHFAEGDVVFAKITPCMENGKGSVATGLQNGIGCGTTELHVIRPLGGIDPHYVYRFLAQPSVRRLAKENFTGTAGQARVPTSFIEELELPLAPLAEQRRIVVKLEKLLGQVDACQQRLEKIPTLLKRFRQSVLAAACSGRLTADWREENPNAETPEQIGEGEPPDNFDLPASWSWLLSAHAFDFVTSGSRGWARYYADDGPAFLRVGNLNHDSIELDLRSIQHVQPPANAEGKRTRVQQGDLLVSVTADVGMIALVDEDIGEAYINQHVALTRPNGNMNRRYLAYFLSARNGGQHQFINLQRGATKVGLGLGDIKNIWIARPPLAEQQEIVRRVAGLFALADQLEQRLAQARKQVDKLTPSLLARAFAGQLAPQKTTDEPAEKLLKRIRLKLEDSVKSL
jgi:type I restriction enzyme S subunit